MILVGLMAAGAFLTACGVRQKLDAPTSAPFASCQIRTYGWSRALGLGQEAWVKLVPRVDLSSVVDLSIFSTLQPGMSDREVRTILGEPSRTEVDRWGEPWLLYDRLAATLKIGCSYESSGDSIPDRCLWRLFALIDAGKAAEIFHPELIRFMATAKAVPEAVEYRKLHVDTSGSEAFVSYDFEGPSQGEILWHDNARSSWRMGKPARH